MKHSIYLFAVAAVLGLGIWGCSEELQPLNSPLPDGGVSSALVVDDPCGQIQETPLLAGQYIPVGVVTVSNNEEVLQVEIAITEPGWVMTEAHCAIEDTFEDLPMTGSGDPQVGHFEFSNEFEYPVTTWACEIILADYGYDPLTELYVAVHAAVELRDEEGGTLQEETAWADGPEFPGNSWATYFSFVVQECNFGPEFFVTYPTGEDLFGPGEWVEVSWTPELFTDVLIELLHNGSVVDTLTWDPYTGLPYITPDEETGALTSYPWQVGCYAEDDPTLYSLRIVSLRDEGDVWTTGQTFTILPCGEE